MVRSAVRLDVQEAIHDRDVVDDAGAGEADGTAGGVRAQSRDRGGDRDQAREAGLGSDALGDVRLDYRDARGSGRRETDACSAKESPGSAQGQDLFDGPG